MKTLMHSPVSMDMHAVVCPSLDADRSEWVRRRCTGSKSSQGFQPQMRRPCVFAPSEHHQRLTSFTNPHTGESLNDALLSADVGRFLQARPLHPH